MYTCLIYLQRSFVTHYNSKEKVVLLSEPTVTSKLCEYYNILFKNNFAFINNSLFKFSLYTKILKYYMHKSLKIVPK